MTERRVHPRKGPTSTPQAADWRDRAACRTEDPDLFFPVGNTGPYLLQIEEAKAVCRRRCPVMETCLNWALETRQDTGIWGGADEAERRALLRKAARAAAKPATKKEAKKQPTPTDPCGTVTAYWRHERRGEPIDDACREAFRRHAAAREARKRAGLPPAPRTLAPCGTRSAYSRHVRHGEPVCEPCREANRVYQRQLAARQKKGATA